MKFFENLNNLTKTFFNKSLSNSQRYTKLNFFTLAEVLIVVGIIGLIAELTIPTLLANVERTSCRSMLVKDFALLSDAFKAIGFDYQGFNLMPAGCSSSSGGNCPVEGNAALVGELSQRIKMVKICRGGLYYGEDASNCWTSSPMISYNRQVRYTNPGQLDWQPWGTSASGFVLSNGATVVLSFDTSENSTYATTTKNPSNYYWYWANGSGDYWNELIIDVNGPKSPNRLGIDIFSFIGDPQRGLYPVVGKWWTDKKGVARIPAQGGSDFDCPREDSVTTSSAAAGNACSWEALMNFDY